ncbi:hypothetical protein [Nocardioides mangrovi]|uniref:Peptidase MA-like domain-containing protein n=1 Tax=Nocardioides mangrovi TaxID=2874580 RepID=A0ABS7U7Q4_9ACTN|nr:hypothetical protein [Nocardioides mangrovi]MBZ5736761.1 hypothetical protein [Nocardioides mangrovi]
MTTDQPPQAGRPRWGATGLVLLVGVVVVAVLVGAGLLAWSLTSDDPYVAPTPKVVHPSVDPEQAASTLEAFEKAVRTHDVDAAEALAPEGDDDAEAWLAAVVRNAEKLRLADVSLRYVTDLGTPGSDGEWDAAVDSTWRMRGFDRHAATAEIGFHLRDDGDRVALTGAGSSDGVWPLWLHGPLQVRRTADTLVLVDGSAAEARVVAARARTAVPQVRRVLPAWQQGLVVEVPASVRDLERTLDADKGTYDQIAAVTTSVDGTTAPSAPVHVFVNPDVYDTLKPTGAQVVMTHESTHVATGAWTSQMPLWLLEGFADYVALRDVDLPVSRTASQIIAQVRKDGPPRALPSSADFGTRTPDLGATYESAWLVCRLLAERGGEDALVSFYRAMDGGTALGTALEQSFGMSVAELTQAWRTELTGLAS